MKLYTQEELREMDGTRFAELYSHLHAWSSTVLGYVPEGCTTSEAVLILQHKKLVAKTLAANICLEMEFMGIPLPFFTL